MGGFILPTCWRGGFIRGTGMLLRSKRKCSLGCCLLGTVEREGTGSLGNIQAGACPGRAGCDVLPMAPGICAVAIRERCLCAVRLQRADVLCQMCSETPLTVLHFQVWFCFCHPESSSTLWKSLMVDRFLRPGLL